MKIRPDQVIEFVTNSYIKDGKDLTAGEIAKALGSSPGTVGRILNECHRDLSCRNGERPYKSRDFGWVMGYRPVTVWEPSKSHLVAMIKSYQHALELEVADNK